MKGVSLPINTTIIIVICITVLLVLMILVFGVINTGRPTIDLETARYNACQLLSSMACLPHCESIIINSFDADGDGQVNETDRSDNLFTLCQNYYGIPDTDAGEKMCKENICNCNVVN